jgi:16S rRNA (guanine527-N7)-methyltransferase
MEPPTIFHEGLKSLGLTLEPETLLRLERYLALLLETNKSFNLTGIKDPDEAWMRHILDSLSLLSWIKEGETVADIGSGGGLPGVVLAIARPDLEVALIEATGKKCTFLCEVAADLELENIRVIPARAEDMGHEAAYREAYDVVTARGVGRLPQLVEYALPLVTLGGRLLAMKGIRGEVELEESENGISILGGKTTRFERAMPGVEDSYAVIIEITKVEETPEEYPRVYGIIKRKTL